MKDTQVTYMGPGLAQLLFGAFLVLKLVHVIDWSWWWVFAPLWIPTGLVVGIVLMGLLMVFWKTVVRK